ncbi:hypothetical protein D9M69_428640 [compost metagenome]
MPGQIVPMPGIDLAQAQLGIEVQRPCAVRIQIVTEADLAVVVEADQTLIEGQIEIGCEQQPVVRIEPLAWAGGAPGFYVRGAQQLGHAAISDGTATPVGEQRLPVSALPDARLDQGVTLGVGQLTFHEGRLRACACTRPSFRHGLGGDLIAEQLQQLPQTGNVRNIQSNSESALRTR